MKPVQLFISLLCVLCAFAVAFNSPAQNAQPSPPKFIIGVWYQPTSSFEKWKSRGINTLVGYEGEGGIVSRRDWMAAARKAGLFYIAKPTGDPDEMKADLADPCLLAWEQPDEPDGGGNVPPEKIIENYKAWKTAGDTPVLLNLDGNKMQWRPAADYEQYVQGADWLSMDLYPLNYGQGPDGITNIGDRLDKLKAWSGGKKKLFCFIECCDQNIKVQDWTQANDATGTPLSPKMRGPTADEIKREVEMAQAHDVSGIIYFPDKIGKGWEGFDGTTPECEVMLKQINAKLSAKSSPKADARKDAPLDGKEITIDGVTYILKKKN